METVDDERSSLLDSVSVLADESGSVKLSFSDVQLRAKR